MGRSLKEGLVSTNSGEIDIKSVWIETNVTMNSNVEGAIYGNEMLRCEYEFMSTTTLSGALMWRLAASAALLFSPRIYSHCILEFAEQQVTFIALTKHSRRW